MSGPGVLIQHYSAKFQQGGKCKSSIANASTHCSLCFDSIDEYHIKARSNSEPVRNENLQYNNAYILDRVRNCKECFCATTWTKGWNLCHLLTSGTFPLLYQTILRYGHIYWGKDRFMRQKFNPIRQDWLSVITRMGYNEVITHRLSFASQLISHPLDLHSPKLVCNLGLSFSKDPTYLHT